LATLREVVEYINAGIPSSADAAAAGNISALFTNPRGPGQTGLGLSDDDVSALVDFLENGLYDPAFVTHDPNSTTETFELNNDDLTYDLALLMLGATNGRVPSGMQHPQTDALTAQDLAAAIDADGICGTMGLFGIMATIVPMLVVRRARRRRR